MALATLKRRLRAQLVTHGMLCSVFYILLQDMQGCAVGFDGGHGNRLDLQERFSFAVPDSFQLAGASMSRSGDVALWASNRPYLIYLGSDAVRIVRDTSLTLPLAAAFVDTSILEVLTDGAMLRFDEHGNLSKTERFAAGVKPTGAARSVHGWFLGAQSATDRQFDIYALGDEGILTLIRSLTARTVSGYVESAGQVGSRHLTASGPLLIATSVRDPFDTVVMDDSGNTLRSFMPDLSGLQILRSDSGVGRNWISLPTVRIGDAYLQVLGDLNSDLRLLFLYNSSGNLVRNSTLDAPVGFLEGADELGIILAARRINGMELVGYSWRWVQDASP